MSLSSMFCATRRRYFSLIAALLLAAVPPRGLAQADLQSSAATAAVKVNVRLVVLDVVVTDASGRVVDGLSAKDFQVYDDGTLQAIRSLEPPSAHSLPAS